MKRASGAMTEDLVTLRERVERWREHRDGGRARVPEDLWAAAVEAARVAGVHATSKALGFNYYNLKDRLALADDVASSEETATREATFVEVKMPVLPSVLPRESSSERLDGTVIELVGSRGARMRIDITGRSDVDVVGLAQVFWSREP